MSDADSTNEDSQLDSTDTENESDDGALRWSDEPAETEQDLTPDDGESDSRDREPPSGRADRAERNDEAARARELEDRERKLEARERQLELQARENELAERERSLRNREQDLTDRGTGEIPRPQTAEPVVPQPVVPAAAVPVAATPVQAAPDATAPAATQEPILAAEEEPETSKGTPVLDLFIIAMVMLLIGGAIGYFVGPLVLGDDDEGALARQPAAAVSVAE